MTTATNYKWMLKNKTTGKINQKMSYTTRDAARRATRSANGRFFNYTPVKVYTQTTSTKPKSKETVTATVKPQVTPTATTTTSTTKSFKTSFTPKSKKRAWYPISKSRYIG